MHFFKLTFVFCGLSSAYRQYSSHDPTHSDSVPTTTCTSYFSQASESFPNKIAFQLQIGNLTGSGTFSIVDIAITTSTRSSEESPSKPTVTMSDTDFNTEWVPPTYGTDFPDNNTLPRFPNTTSNSSAVSTKARSSSFGSPKATNLFVVNGGPPLTSNYAHVSALLSAFVVPGAVITFL